MSSSPQVHGLPLVCPIRNTLASPHPTATSTLRVLGRVVGLALWHVSGIPMLSRGGARGGVGWGRGTYLIPRSQQISKYNLLRTLHALLYKVVALTLPVYRWERLQEHGQKKENEGHISCESVTHHPVAKHKHPYVGRACVCA